MLMQPVSQRAFAGLVSILWLVLTGVQTPTAAAQHTGRAPSDGSFRLQEELVIGGDLVPTDYAFNRITDLVVSPSGTIYVLDAGDRTVKTYDASGRFLRAFGREGMGPGEFLSPVDIKLDSLVHVFDAQQNRVSSFTLDGQHRRTRQLSAPDGVKLATSYLLENGYTVGGTAARFSFGSPAHDPNRTVVLLSPRGHMDTLLVYHSGASVWHRAGEMIPWGLARSDFGPAGAWAIQDDSIVATVDGYTGQTTWYRVAGDSVIRSVTRKIPIVAREISEEDIRALEQRFRAERDRQMGRLDFVPPPRWSGATDALFAQDGSLWIQNGADPERARVWTVLESDGRIAYRLRLPPDFSPKHVTAQRLYGIAETENDAHIVRVYRLERSAG